MGAELNTGNQGATTTVDALVIGAGFGGLGTALHLAESGSNVLLCEALNYPGGCASTFERGGASYESGATLFAGFDEGQLFERWIDRYGLDVPLETHDPIVTLRTALATIEVGAEREEFIARIVHASDADEAKIRAFFRYQQRIADTLWALFDNPERLPPFDLATLFSHARSLTAYAPLLRLVGRSVATVLKRYALRTSRCALPSTVFALKSPGAGERQCSICSSSATHLCMTLRTTSSLWTIARFLLSRATTSSSPSAAKTRRSALQMACEP